MARTTAATAPIPKTATATTGSIASRIERYASTISSSPVVTVALPPTALVILTRSGPPPTEWRAAESRSVSRAVRWPAVGAYRKKTSGSPAVASSEAAEPGERSRAACQKCFTSSPTSGASAGARSSGSTAQ